jgi:predicted ATPase/DNA-binding XRE family transcriptional regulator
MHETISFGTWLRQKRRALDLTQKAFADQIGCAEITVRRMEADEYKPSKELAFVLFEKLGIPEPERSQWISFARGVSDVPSPSNTLLKKSITNLPAALTTFIGREKEQAAVIHLIAKHRLVTLTGSGGVGKTRLSIKVGEQIVGNYVDGVWLVQLATILDPLLVSRTTAIALGLRAKSRRPVIDILCDYLREKNLLIILDNCEQLVNACAKMTNQILHAAPNVRILATSREAFGMEGELTYRVPSLGVPETQSLPQVDTLIQYEAVKLFVDRATSAVPAFTVTNDNISFIAQICYRLDGIPLAIELAAAKVRVLSIEQITDRLDDRFRLLIGGNRTALARYQTLRATIDWSYNLLTPREQVLLRRLSVFVGGWTLESAESICEGGSVKTEDVLYMLEQLINKSLVIVEEAGQAARYRMLETIRQYAREKLAESGEGKVVRSRHLDFFLAIALRFKHEVHGSQALNWMKRVNTEHDNLREAMNGAGEAGEALSGLRLGAALHYYWLAQGYWGLGRELLERLLARPEAAGHTLARADALNLAGDLATQLGDLKAARTLLEESKAIGLELSEEGKRSLGWARMLLGQSWMGHNTAMAQHELNQSIVLLREAGEAWRLAIALLLRGGLAGDQGDLVQAHEFFSESLAILQKNGDTWTAALPTQSLGWVFYCLGEYTIASAHLQQALAIYRTAEDKNDIPGPLAHLGSIAVLEGNDDQATRYFDERLVLARELMNKAMIANALCDLGIVTGHLGDFARSTALLHEGLRLSQEIDNMYLIAACLAGLTSIQQKPHRAAQMLAASRAAFERSGRFIEPLYRVEHERAESRIREVLNAQDFGKFSEEGYAMRVEQVIALALETME